MIFVIPLVLAVLALTLLSSPIPLSRHHPSSLKIAVVNKSPITTDLHAGRRSKGSSHRGAAMMKSAGQKKGSGGGLERFLRHHSNTTDSVVQRTILVVDANNVRGKTDFQWTHRDLFRRLQAWRRGIPSLQVVCVLDHACHAQARFLFCDDMPLLVVWAGPDRTADDVIARASHWFTTTATSTSTSTSDDQQPPPPPYEPRKERHSTVVVAVVTSDRELERRCRQSTRRPVGKSRKKQRKKLANKSSTSSLLQIFSSPELVQCLEDVDMDECHPASEKLSSWSKVEEHLQELEVGLRRYESHSEGATATATSKRQPMGVTSQPPIFNERTWHRVLIAEYFRRMSAECCPVSPAAAPAHSILSQYQSFYEQQKERQQPTTTMFLDHRIRHDPHQQQQLLRYVDHSMAGGGGENEKNESNQSPRGVEDRLVNGGGRPPSHESCAAIARAKVPQTYGDNRKNDSHNKVRFYNEHAPSELQFSSRNSDLFQNQLFSLLGSEEEKQPNRDGGDNTQTAIDRTRQSADPVMVALGTFAEELWWRHKLSR